MRTFLGFWITCALLSAGAFGALLAIDRRLDVALPYSIPIAFAAMLAIAPLLLVAADRFRVRYPAPVRVAQPRAAAPASAAAPPIARRPAGAQGVVLLDFSRAARTERAA
jgi:hypothetical protein